jgi:hypothetical protein
MNPDWYIKPVEQLMLEGKIGVIHYSLRPAGENKWGQPKKEHADQWWIAEKLLPKGGWVTGEGQTPREAIIDLYKNLE